MRLNLRSFLPGKKALIRISIGLGVLLVLLVGSVEYTSQPSFCSTCHYMEPYYNSWAHSPHADVQCTSCHFPPGLAGTIRGKMAGLVQLVNYAGQSYTRRKPWAEIEDASCLQSGCHVTEELKTDVDFKGVKFDHTPHLEEMWNGIDLRCTSCHAQVFQEEHIRVTETNCILCHFKKDNRFPPPSEQPVVAEANVQIPAAIDLPHEGDLTNCETCHNWAAVPADSMETFRFDHTNVVAQGTECTHCHTQTVVGDGFVPPDNCSSCHYESQTLEKYNDPRLVHEVHIVENKIECVQCHLRIQHKIIPVSSESELNCTTCHESTHKEQLMLFTGAPVNGVQGEPNPMFDIGLNCASCHVFHKQLIGEAGVQTASPQSCETCHGEGYSRLLNLWEQAAASKLARLGQDISRVERTVRQLRPDSMEAIQTYIGHAKEAMHLVQVGKSVHNVNYADQLVRSGHENLNRALATAGASYQLTGFETSSVVPSECANCHTGIEEQSGPFRGSQFSHSTHAVDESIACNTCHSNAREHGQLILSPTECNNCHHEAERIADLNCAQCHQTEAALYAGTYQDKDEPDYMFFEDITCDECHASNHTIVKPTVAVCVDCHDQEYEDMGNEWKQDVATLTQEVRTLLDQAPASFKQSAAYRQAQTVLRDLGRSGGGGLHNYELTMSLLKEIQTQVPAPAQ